MKKFYTFLSMVTACILCAFSAQAAQITFIVDNPDAVQIRVTNYTTNTNTSLDLQVGENVINFDTAEYSRAEINATSDYKLISVTGADSSYGDLSVYYNMASIDLNEYSDGRVYTINVVDLNEFRSASVTVNVTDDPSLVRVYRGSEYVEIDENPKTVKFNPESETYFQISRTDYQNLCNVKLNGVSLSNPTASFEVKDGDEIEVTALFPDVMLPVSFAYPEGMDNIIRSVSVDYNTVTDWNTPDFAVKSGSKVSFQLNDSDYKIDGVYINDELKTSYSNYFDFTVGLEAVDVVIEAHPWATLSFTVNVNEPDQVSVMSYYGETFALTGTSTTLSVTEKSPTIVIKAASGYIIESLTDGDGNPITLDQYSKSLSVTDGMVINIVTKEKEFDASFAVYLDTTEDLYSYYWSDEESREYTNFTAGYNIVKFISAQEVMYQVSVSGINEWVAYLNGEPVNNQYSSPYYSWRGIPEDGMVIKIFTSGVEPEIHSVTLNVSDELADKVTAVYDRLTAWPDFGTAVSLHAGSLVELTLADDADAVVRVDGTPVEADENGVHFVTVSAAHEITVSASNAITSAEAVTESTVADVYNLQGIRVLSGATADDLKTLPAGLYIFGGTKVAVK